MDVPLAHRDSGIHYGLQEYKRMSSVFYHQADVVGLLCYSPKFLVKSDRKRGIVYTLIIN